MHSILTDQPRALNPLVPPMDPASPLQPPLPDSPPPPLLEPPPPVQELPLRSRSPAHTPEQAATEPPRGGARAGVEAAEGSPEPWASDTAADAEPSPMEVDTEVEGVQEEELTAATVQVCAVPVCEYKILFCALQAKEECRAVPSCLHIKIVKSLGSHHYMWMLRRSTSSSISRNIS